MRLSHSHLAYSTLCCIISATVPENRSNCDRVYRTDDSPFSFCHSLGITPKPERVQQNRLEVRPGRPGCWFFLRCGLLPICRVKRVLGSRKGKLRRIEIQTSSRAESPWDKKITTDHNLNYSTSWHNPSVPKNLDTL